MERPASENSLKEVRAVWATDPERIDPDDYPARAPFARVVTWAPCPTCDHQVHTPVSLYLLQGIWCPECGAALTAAPDDPTDRLSLALRREDEFSRRLETHVE